MVQRKRPTGRANKAEPHNTDLLTRAARMVGTALGSISVKVRGEQNDEIEQAKAAEAKHPRKAAAKKSAARKAGTNRIPMKRRKISRAKKDKLQR